MSSGFTPVNQVRLTNVAYVRLQKKGKRFEIACYRNKIVSWRNKIETNLEEVLQVATVFTNVSKGMLASSTDLMESFGTTDQMLVCKEILDKGEMQISEQERIALLASIFSDVASIVVDKSVNPENNRPYTISMIENAMNQIHFSASTSKSSKSQALEVIRKLKAIMPIARASMHLRIVCPSSDVMTVKDQLLKNLNIPIFKEYGATESLSGLNLHNEIHKTGQDKSMTTIEVLVDPEYYKKIEEGVIAITGLTGRVEVLQMRVHNHAVHTNSGHVITTTDNGGGNKQNHPISNKIESEPSLTLIESCPKLAEVLPESGLLLTSVEKDGHRMNEENEQDYGDDDEQKSDIIKKLSKNGMKASLKERYMNKEGENDETIGAIGMASKEKRKKTKSKKGGVVSYTDNIIDSELDLDLDTTGADSSATLLVPSRQTSSTLSVKDNKSGSKKGKTTKRIEKQENIELAQRAEKLRIRIEEKKTKDDILGITTQILEPAAAAAEVSTDTNTMSVLAAKSCNTCGGLFGDSTSYRNHFRSDWHRENLSRKLKNLPLILSEEEFSKLSLRDLELNKI